MSVQYDSEQGKYDYRYEHLDYDYSDFDEAPWECTIKDVVIAVAESYLDFIGDSDYNTFEEMIAAYKEDDSDFEDEVFHVAQDIIETDCISNVKVNFDEGCVEELEDCSWKENGYVYHDYDIVDSMLFEEFLDEVIKYIKKGLEK